MKNIPQHIQKHKQNTIALKLDRNCTNWGTDMQNIMMKNIPQHVLRQKNTFVQLTQNTQLPQNAYKLGIFLSIFPKKHLKKLC